MEVEHMTANKEKIAECVSEIYRERRTRRFKVELPKWYRCLDIHNKDGELGVDIQGDTKREFVKVPVDYEDFGVEISLEHRENGERSLFLTVDESHGEISGEARENAREQSGNVVRIHGETYDRLAEVQRDLNTETQEQTVEQLIAFYREH